MNSFYNEEELKTLGLKKYGKNVLISRKASIYSPDLIEIGDNVRIDDFALLSGRIIIGNTVHISAYAALYACEKKIEIKDYAGISPRTTVFSQTDDYSGEYMSNAMAPEEYRNVLKAEVIIDKYAQLGTNCVVLPGVVIGEGTSVGAMSLINKSLDEWSIYVGIPCKKIGNRKKRILNYEKKMKDK